MNPTTNTGSDGNQSAIFKIRKANLQIPIVVRILRGCSSNFHSFSFNSISRFQKVVSASVSKGTNEGGSILVACKNHQFNTNGTRFKIWMQLINSFCKSTQNYTRIVFDPPVPIYFLGFQVTQVIKEWNQTGGRECVGEESLPTPI